VLEETCVSGLIQSFLKTLYPSEFVVDAQAIEVKLFASQGQGRLVAALRAAQAAVSEARTVGLVA
jgi:repressor of nif and glnA expression